MTSTEQRTSRAVPAPRTGVPDARSGAAGAVDPERWRRSVRPRPSRHYWDVDAACWRTRDGRTPEGP